MKKLCLCFCTMILLAISIVSAQEVSEPVTLSIKNKPLDIPERLIGGSYQFPVLEIELQADGDAKLMELWFLLDSNTPQEYDAFWILDENKKRLNSINGSGSSYSGALAFGSKRLEAGKSYTWTLWAETLTSNTNVNDIFAANYVLTDADFGVVDGEDVRAMDKAYKNEEGLKAIRRHVRPNLCHLNNTCAEEEKEVISKPMVLEEPIFKDVEDASTYHDAISYVKDAGIVSGYDDGRYRPDNTITRAEFLKIVIGASFSASEIQNCNMATQFSDAQSNQWYYPYLCVAVNRGIVKGYDDGTFKPGNSIAFTEAAKIIALAQGLEFQSEAVWYAPYVGYLQDQNSIPVAVGALTKNITRAEMAEMVYRINNKITHKASRDLLK